MSLPANLSPFSYKTLA